MSNQWKESDNALHKTFKFKTYIDGAEFTMKVAQKAEEVMHHPEIMLRYRVVKIRTTTYDAKSTVTDKDQNLVKEIDHIYEAYQK